MYLIAWLGTSFGFFSGGSVNCGCLEGVAGPVFMSPTCSGRATTLR